MIVDDGGDATMMIIEGAKWEQKYEENQTLPDPERVSTEDEKELFKFLRIQIPQNPKLWRSVISEMSGVSEETTTGVHRLYRLAE